MVNKFHINSNLSYKNKKRVFLKSKSLFAVPFGRYIVNNTIILYQLKKWIVCFADGLKLNLFSLANTNTKHMYDHMTINKRPC